MLAGFSYEKDFIVSEKHWLLGGTLQLSARSMKKISSLVSLSLVYSAIVKSL